MLIFPHDKKWLFFCPLLYIYLLFTRANCHRKFCIEYGPCIFQIMKSTMSVFATVYELILASTLSHSNKPKSPPRSALLCSNDSKSASPPRSSTTAIDPEALSEKTGRRTPCCRNIFSSSSTKFRAITDSRFALSSISHARATSTFCSFLLSSLPPPPSPSPHDAPPCSASSPSGTSPPAAHPRGSAPPAAPPATTPSTPRSQSSNGPQCLLLQPLHNA